MGWGTAGRIWRHPDIADLYVEVSMTGFQEASLAIDWSPRFPRILHRTGEIPTKWTGVSHDDYVFPMRLRRTGPRTVECQC
jgi:hypothetical protein